MLSTKIWGFQTMWIQLFYLVSFALVNHDTYGIGYIFFSSQITLKVRCYLFEFEIFHFIDFVLA